MRVNVYIDSGKILYKEDVDLLNFIISTHDEEQDVNFDTYVNSWYAVLSRILKEREETDFYYYTIKRV